MSTRNAFIGATSAFALVGWVGCSSGPDEPTDALSQAAGTAQHSYAYEPSGLSTSVAANGSSYTISRQGDVLTAGSSKYRYDALGRVTAIDDRTISYGPDGQIARLTRGARTVSYVYDEDGQRVLESIDGAPTAVFDGDKRVTAPNLDEPVRAGGQLVGLVRNGRFSLLATDARGTVQADTNGAQRLAAPFGERDVHPDVAAAIDYAAKGWDGDLRAVRMGVRDYDPRIDRFLQPDPLYLEHPEKCIEHVVDCNLYTYARNNPVQIVDPTGKDGISIGVGAGIVGGLFDRLKAGVSIEGGVFIDFGKNWRNWRRPTVSVYVTTATVSPRDNGTIAFGAAAGANVAGNYVRDSSSFWGKGASTQLGSHTVVGAQLSTDSDGNPTGGGLSAGVSEGVAIAVMETNTVDVVKAVKGMWKPGKPVQPGFIGPGAYKRKDGIVVPNAGSKL